MYKDISRNKTKTAILLFFFSVFAIFLVTSVSYFAGLDLISSFIVGGTFSVVYALISYYGSKQIALMSSGAKRVTKQDAYELYVLVENLAITAGLPMPELYVINDDAPNAFATGRDPEHSAIAVTTGLLSRLNKLELEGVLAHELSHIKNYDIRVMTIVVVLVGLVVLVSDFALRLSFFRGERKGGGQIAIIMLVFAIISAIVAPLISSLIQFAVSRSREYLADASGALLTRNPDGLASALRKISDANMTMTKANHATAHLFISNPFGKKSSFASLFSTHPPTEKRIERLMTMGR